MSENYDEIKEAIQKLQEKMEALEKENQKPKEEEEKKEENIYADHREAFDNAGDYASQEMDKILGKNGVKAMAMCISKSIMFSGSGTCISSACIESFDDISEEGLSAAVEVFTNPRRIAILKILIAHPETLTATEITQRTGLVGGQLYHHLSNLENAGLVIKENEKYRAHGSAHGLLISLYAVVGRMNIAKN